MKLDKHGTAEAIPSGVVRFAVGLSLGALLFLISMTALISSVLNEMEIEFENVFIDVNQEANEMWSTLMSLGDGVSRTKRQMVAEYGLTQTITEYVQPHTTSPSAQNNYARPNNYQPPPPKYGYGYTKLKCCCADSYATPGANENLPISYKCPVGYKGPSGPQGESGEPGLAGVPGYPGTPAWNIYPEARPNGEKSGLYDTYPTANNQYGGSDSYAQPQIKICVEPCPSGPSGPPGSKGARGLVGQKGIRGAFGESGRPGKPGKCGPQGDIGPRGMNGFPGPKGPDGANGIKGCKGSPGRKGIPGSIGVAGPRGLGGQPGDYGVPGLPGLCGRPGSKGPRGIDGVPGSAGAPGRSGKDALYCPCPPKSQPQFYAYPQQQPPLSQYPVASLPQYSQQYEQVVGGSSQESLTVQSYSGDSEASYTGIPQKTPEENLPLQAVSVSYFGDSSFTSAPQPPAPPPQEIADYINQNFGNGEGVKRADPRPRGYKKHRRLIDWPRWKAGDEPTRRRTSRSKNTQQGRVTEQGNRRIHQQSTDTNPGERRFAKQRFVNT